MAEEQAGSDDRTEEATPERREDFRDRGQVVVSGDLTSVLVLGACVIAFTAAAPAFLGRLEHLLVTHFQQLATRRIDRDNVLAFFGNVWAELLWTVIPAFLVTLLVASAGTLLQTGLNWSWQRVKPDFSRLNLFAGLARFFQFRIVVELLKGVAKMAAVGLVAFLILRGEWDKVPQLMNYPMQSSWIYWGGITRQLFWAVAGFLLAVAGADYAYNFFTTEKQMKMTKQEVKEDFKRRELDPHLKGRMRRMARELATKKTLANTRKATVLITNPTHYSIALRYEPGDGAPRLLAKGVDLIALKMREVAKDAKIPIIENRPLARELYATVEEGDEIPSKLYKTVAEIIRYVFKLKGQKLPPRRAANPVSSAPPGGPAAPP